MATVTPYGRHLAELKATFIDSALDSRSTLTDDLETFHFLLKLLLAHDKQAFVDFLRAQHAEFSSLPAIAFGIFGLAKFTPPREYAKLRAEGVFRALVDKYEAEEEAYLAEISGNGRKSSNTLKLWAKAPIFHPTEIYFARTGMSEVMFPMRTPGHEVLLHALPLASILQLSRLMQAIGAFPSAVYKSSEIFPPILDSFAIKTAIPPSVSLDVVANLQRVWIRFKTRETRKSFDRVLDLIASSLAGDTHLLMDEKHISNICEFALSIDTHKRHLIIPLARRVKAACIGSVKKLSPDTLALVGYTVETLRIGDAGFREFLGSYLMNPSSFASILGLIRALKFARSTRDSVILETVEAALIERINTQGTKQTNVATAIAILQSVEPERIEDYRVKDKLMLLIEERKDQIIPAHLVDAIEGISRIKNVRSFLKSATAALPYLQPLDVLRICKSFVTSYDMKQEQLAFFVDSANTLLDPEIHVPERDAPLLLDCIIAFKSLHLNDRIFSAKAKAQIASEMQMNYVNVSRTVGPLGVFDISGFLNAFQDAVFTDEFANEVIKNGYRCQQFFKPEEVLGQLFLLVRKVTYPEFAIKYLKQQVFTRLGVFDVNTLVLILRALRQAVPDLHAFESSCLRPVLLEICERKGRGSSENTDAFEFLLDEMKFPEHKIALFTAIRIGQQCDYFFFVTNFVCRRFTCVRKQPDNRTQRRFGRRPLLCRPLMCREKIRDRSLTKVKSCSY